MTTAQLCFYRDERHEAFQSGVDDLFVSAKSYLSQEGHPACFKDEGNNSTEDGKMKQKIDNDVINLSLKGQKCKCIKGI